MGVDVGASRTKVAILDGSKNLIGRAVKKSGTDFAATADTCLELALKMSGSNKSDIENTVASGYGRKNVSFARDTKTEIGCHAKGCYYYFPIAATIIDIGGQDNKIIKLDSSGKRTGFKMNRKCAASTRWTAWPVNLKIWSNWGASVPSFRQPKFWKTYARAKTCPTSSKGFSIRW